MNHSKFAVRFLGLALGLALGVASCFPEPSGLESSTAAGAGGGSGAAVSSGAPGASEAGSAGDAPTCTPRPAQEGAACHPVVSADLLPGRAVTGAPVASTVFQSELVTAMKAQCGACHYAPSTNGGFSFSEGNFKDVVDQKVLDAIQSNVETCDVDGNGQKVDPKCIEFMPPSFAGGKKWSARQADPADPLQPLVRLLTQWLAQGQSDPFTVPPDPGATSPYSVTQELAGSLTNLGSCVPDAGMVGTDPTTCDMDARFAAMAIDPNGAPNARLGLPATLDQTDLTSFDSAMLAKNSVVAYVPAYPLWSDDAGKLRMVRVPVGQSITYDRKTKQFDIPANTRFYKTFMKKVKSADGVFRYHKIETRLIVSRPRDANNADQSLFGTYEWNDDESQATLLTDPQNNGAPFVDKVKTLVIDEGVQATVLALVKNGKVNDYTYEMENRHATRRYAMPGSTRCVQCHMGSPSQSFVLGFTPLQLNVRPCSPDEIASTGHCDSGQVEPATGDELTQVERLTSYGVISGYGSAELQKLEDPQGTSKDPRPVRTPEELVAQAYMLGNCAHCHNPNGYPSIEHPELVPLLNFLPGTAGGIFGFPFERYSPRIFRNSTGDGPIAYISPSLRDRFGNIDNGWLPKAVRGGNSPVTTTSDGVEAHFIDAPWRSLIYRNVDTPFTYVDDAAIYPHMPLNTPGYDCRAPRFIGEWMVSIPALAKHPTLTENVSPQAGDTLTGDVLSSTELDPQPYREVKPGDPDYYSGVAQATTRLAAFRAGLRDSNYCPDTSDIVDVAAERQSVLTNSPPIPSDGEVATLPRENVPDRPTWISVDLTSAPGPWSPRKANWEDVLVKQDLSSEQKATPSAQDQTDLIAETHVVALLQGVTLPIADSDDPASELFFQKFPFGFWQQKAGCKFDKLDPDHGFGGKFSDYAAKSDGSSADPSKPHLRWMDLNTAPPGTPVYSATPGSLVFNMICVNCHGPDADSGGRQAQTVAEMTGGIARVANFRDGLFGPFGTGTNRVSVFPSEDVAARYLPWMALGGTSVKIPRPILQLVGNTPVLGSPRRGIVVNSANMLQTAQALCYDIGQIKPAGGLFDLIPLQQSQLVQAQLHGGNNGSFIAANGDEDLWERLCTYNNPAPIHGLSVSPPDDNKLRHLDYNPANLFFASKFPANNPTGIGDGQGRVQATLTADNTAPWCVIRPPASDADALAWFNSPVELQDGALAPLPAFPVCPDAVIAEDNRFKAPVDANSVPLRSDMDDWAARGAINAGQAVFVYLRHMISEGNGRDLTYNECDKLGN